MKLSRITTKKSPIAKIKELLNMKFSTSVFVISMLSILIIGGAGIILFNNYFNPPAPDSLQSMTPVTTEPVSLTLNLSNPENNSMVFSEDLLIQGKTNPKSVVILSTNTEDLLLEPNQQGDFSLTVKLQKGLNLLSVNVFDNLGTSKVENRTIYYSEEKI